MNRQLRYVFVAIALGALGACGDSKGKVADFLARADAFKAQGNLTKAQLEFQNALKLDPSNPQINLAVAQINEAAGDFAEAFPYYLRAATPEAHLLDAQVRVVEILIDSGRFQDALGMINSTIGAFPTNATAVALRADIEERQGQLTSAQADADTALQRDPVNARALAVSAMLKLRARDGQGAMALVDRGLAKHPDDLRLLQVRAAAAMTLSQPEKALDAFQSIVRAAPHNVLAQRALADLETQNGHFDQALANFKAAVDADPGNQDMQLAFVGFLSTQKRDADVIGFVQSLIAKYPQGSTYPLVLAEFYRTRGDLAKSRDVLEQASAKLADTPAGLAIKVALAKVDVNAEQLAAAQTRLNAVVAVDPQNTDALLVRAVLDQQNGRSARAVSDLLTIVRNDPVNARAFQALATAYTSLGDPKLATDAMRRAIAVAPGDDGAEIRLAAFLQSGGAADAAKELMARITLRRPNTPEVWLANARLAIERNDWNTASRSLARLQDLPNSARTAETLDGQMKAARGDFAGAVASYKAVIDADATVDPAVVGGFARASVASNHTADGAAYLAQKAPTMKGDAVAAAWLAVTTMQADARNFPKAAEAFQHLTQAAPRAVSTYAAYVNILIGQKAFDTAKAVIATGLDAGASKWQLLLLRGSVEEAAGRFAAAQVSYKAALDSNPLSLSAANNYASILADQEPKNIVVLGEARGKLSGLENSTSPTLLDTIAWLDYRLGRFDEARALLERIGAAQSDNPQIRLHMAAVLIASGDKSGGMALLETLKGLAFPGSQEVQSLSAT